MEEDTTFKLKDTRFASTYKKSKKKLRRKKGERNKEESKTKDYLITASVRSLWELNKRRESGLSQEFFSLNPGFN